MFAYDYPILGIFWSMLMFFIWVAWLMVLFNVIIDIFRSSINGFGKAAWILVVLVLPLLGVLIYLLANGDDMQDRQVARMQSQQADMDSYIRSAAGSSSGVAEEIAKLSELQSSGAITAEEFASQKAKLLA